MNVDVITLRERHIMRDSVSTFVAVFLLAILLDGSSAFGDRPNETPKRLRELSSHVCVGTVLALNAKTHRSVNWEQNRYKIEIEVASVLKGAGIRLKDKITVISSSQVWIGDPDPRSMPVGWNGMGAPSKNAQVLVYLKEVKPGYFKFIEPNGFSNLERLRKSPDKGLSHMSKEEWDLTRDKMKIKPASSIPAKND